ncbi:NAD(P)H-binding protein [Rhodoplanes sp. TEM]|uniref:NAD(P)H-binding protein n=1 Tax=Rhodoplanes tepidamans TaxID=200616 RepID=A0ABT5JA31_RHOTP|nr:MULTISPECIES: NAD(P)H-binding protein [Rhodoplanes]MDC7786541.1 NAD(P)H-binding protein [Rhodoplanes tepidamans]MDC7983121.1 NAD(P)H-binding protein [Rhodoplanes sp. TEM]MDQ0357579.1 putative NADH-flavin reductase [Rhodoplanes tepidamans]
MARVLIVGASKGIGFETMIQALAAGHEVRAFARSAPRIKPAPGLEIVRGNALKRDDVAAAVQGMDVVIQALGIGLADMIGPVRLFSESTKHLIAAMETHRVRRLISVTGFGAGESRSSINLIQYGPFVLVFGRAYDDKSRQERLIKESGLDWTIARPGVLTNGHRTREYRVLVEKKQWRNGLVSREDVADFLVGQIGDRSLIGKAPVLVY